MEEERLSLLTQVGDSFMELIGKNRVNKRTAYYQCLCGSKPKKIRCSSVVCKKTLSCG